jgi:hypothetical protein
MILRAGFAAIISGLNTVISAFLSSLILLLLLIALVQRFKRRQGVIFIIQDIGLVIRLKVKVRGVVSIRFSLSLRVNIK